VGYIYRLKTKLSQFFSVLKIFLGFHASSPCLSAILLFSTFISSPKALLSSQPYAPSSPPPSTLPAHPSSSTFHPQQQSSHPPQRYHDDATFGPKKALYFTSYTGSLIWSPASTFPIIIRLYQGHSLKTFHIVPRNLQPHHIDKAGSPCNSKYKTDINYSKRIVYNQSFYYALIKK
jgi:hypothetical protein